MTFRVENREIEIRVRAQGKATNPKLRGPVVETKIPPPPIHRRLAYLPSIGYT